MFPNILLNESLATTNYNKQASLFQANLLQLQIQQQQQQQQQQNVKKDTSNNRVNSTAMTSPLIMPQTNCSLLEPTSNNSLFTNYLNTYLLGALNQQQQQQNFFNTNLSDSPFFHQSDKNATRFIALRPIKKFTKIHSFTNGTFIKIELFPILLSQYLMQQQDASLKILNILPVII